ncbi:carbohydrate ABC transporter permease [Microbacterium lacus]|uniref:Carbohydrate ABC transporter permease n=1 Tax=Microbacterium lacus TaxID=415217 RepID=A0ABN2FXB4_9MICO
MTVTKSGRAALSARATSILRLLPALVWAIVILIPLGYMLMISLSTRAHYAQSPTVLQWPPVLDNYVSAWQQGSLPQAFVNNTVVTAAAVLLVVLLGSAAAYGIIRWRGRLKGPVYGYFALGLIVPFQLGLPMLFQLWAQWGLADSLVGVTIVHVGAGLPFAVFVFSGFLLTVPRELEEAAMLDGASTLRVFVSVVLPLLKPATATVVVFTAIGVWNDLLISLFFLQSPGNLTLSRTALAFQSTYNSDVPLIFAAAILIVIPVVLVFVILQRSILSGLTQGALRG